MDAIGSFLHLTPHEYAQHLQLVTVEKVSIPEPTSQSGTQELFLITKNGSPRCRCNFGDGGITLSNVVHPDELLMDALVGLIDRNRKATSLIVLVRRNHGERCGVVMPLWWEK